MSSSLYSSTRICSWSFAFWFWHLSFSAISNASFSIHSCFSLSQNTRFSFIRLFSSRKHSFAVSSSVLRELTLFLSDCTSLLLDCAAVSWFCKSRTCCFKVEFSCMQFWSSFSRRVTVEKFDSEMFLTFAFVFESSVFSASLRCIQFLKAAFLRLANGISFNSIALLWKVWIRSLSRTAFFADFVFNFDVHCLAKCPNLLHLKHTLFKAGHGLLKCPYPHLSQIWIVQFHGFLVGSL